MVDGLKSKTLMENDKGVLSDRVRVSEDSKVVVGNSNSGTVISETESKSVESGNLGNSDKLDVSKNRAVEMMPNNNRWESWGVMNMVGRVLDGKFYMDKEVEDVKSPANEGAVNLASDVDAWQGVVGEPTEGAVNLASDVDTWQDEIREPTEGVVNLASDVDVWQDLIGEPASEDMIDIKTVVDNDSVMLDLSCLGGESDLIGKQDLVSDEILPNRPLEVEVVNDVVVNDVEVNDVKGDVFIPKGHAEYYVTEKEGEYYVSDLVWGKVRSHPWWPGQIFAPSAASDKAARHFRRDSYLIAYFGDQTFAWNEEAKIKPYRMYFSEMEKQSNGDGFCHAVHSSLDELARRVEYGLSCPCLPLQVQDEIKYQVVSNAGIREESSRRVGGDNISSAASFFPGETLQFLESLAECPQSKPDRLQFTIAKVQLLAFKRWKGHYKLPVFEECGWLLEDYTQLNASGVMEGLVSVPVSEVADEFSFRKRESTTRDGSYRKRKHLLGDEDTPKRKEKFMSVLMSSGSTSLQNNDKKRRIATNSKGKRRKSLQSTGLSGELTSLHESSLRVGDRTCMAVQSGEKCCEATQRIDGKLASDGAGKPQTASMIPAEIPAPDMILAELSLAARNPKQGHDARSLIVGFLCEFRNSVCLEKSVPANVTIDYGNHRREQPSNTQTADTIGVGGTEDTYWTDRIIQSYSQDQVVFVSQKPNERDAQPEADAAVASNLEDNKKRDATAALDTGNPSASMDEASEEYRPTALILNFSNLESIPPVPNLNEIFRRYGPLNESETKILSKSKRAKVIFKRRADAETAFSSTGKYSTFGPSLVSYRLHYAPKPRESRATQRRTKGQVSGS